jgi:hypothetical protein
MRFRAVPSSVALGIVIGLLIALVLRWLGIAFAGP